MSSVAKKVLPRAIYAIVGLILGVVVTEAVAIAYSELVPDNAFTYIGLVFIVFPCGLVVGLVWGGLGWAFQNRIQDHSPRTRFAMFFFLIPTVLSCILVFASVIVQELERTPPSTEALLAIYEGNKSEFNNLGLLIGSNITNSKLFDQDLEGLGLRRAYLPSITTSQLYFKRWEYTVDDLGGYDYVEGYAYTPTTPGFLTRASYCLDTPCSSDWYEYTHLDGNWYIFKAYDSGRF